MLHMEQKPVSRKHNKEIGQLGEDLASKYLIKRGFVILARNYLKKWGEIDIVARETSGKVHFVEVKTVSYETKQYLEQAVTRRTWRPEENVHPQKIKRLSRAIETWLAEKRYLGDWQIDIIAVRVVPREKYGKIKLIDNIIIWELLRSTCNTIRLCHVKRLVLTSSV